MNAAAFLRQAVQHPTSTGAVAPSSKRLSQLMVKHASLACAECVVELGPGTGAITKEILSVKDETTRFVGVERNLQFFNYLDKTFAASQHSSARFVYGDANDLAAHLGHKPCDRIISGLPWAGFSTVVQNRLLEAISGSLSDTGLFLTFAYHPFNHLPRGRSFFRQLNAHFSEVRRTEMVVNIPPASIYVCRK